MRCSNTFNRNDALLQRTIHVGCHVYENFEYRCFCNYEKLVCFEGSSENK